MYFFLKYFFVHLVSYFFALYALILNNSERRSFCALNLKNKRRSRRAHEIESGAQSAAL